jgi:hypothetical protein
VKRIRLMTAAALAVLSACASMDAAIPDPGARAPRLEGYGRLDFPITTASPAAQELFTRGVLQAYAFNEDEAVRAFKAALALDPGCAMCAWGAAWQLGPNINAPERGDLAEARLGKAWPRADAALVSPSGA